MPKTPELGELGELSQTELTGSAESTESTAAQRTITRGNMARTGSVTNTMPIVYTSRPPQKAWAV